MTTATSVKVSRELERSVHIPAGPRKRRHHCIMAYTTSEKKSPNSFLSCQPTNQPTCPNQHSGWLCTAISSSSACFNIVHSLWQNETRRATSSLEMQLDFCEAKMPSFPHVPFWGHKGCIPQPHSPVHWSFCPWTPTHSENRLGLQLARRATL